MDPEPFTAVGRIAKTHGLKGEVSVVSYAGTSLDVLVGLEAWLVPPPVAVRTTRIVGVRPGPKGPLVALEGVESIEAAASLGGCELLVATDALPTEWAEDLDESCDLIGYAVFDERRGDLGEIVEIIETGANDVWTVEGPFGEVLLPVIDEVVLDVDDDARRVKIRLLRGLLPEEGEEA